jgi:hypothetical protein
MTRRATPRIVNNDATAAATSVVEHGQFNRFTFNLQTNKASLRHDRMEGREYLVAPCVMLTEGVHAGSQGSLYYPADELSKFPAIWNTRPVVVYHPTQNGQGVSAADPVVFDKQRIGLLMNTRFEAGALKADAWLDTERMKAVDDRVLNALESNTVMEVSTGLYTDNELVEGEWNGEKYKAIARNYRPDHLAILPDQKGACSIADGAGLLRNEAAKTGPAARLAASLLATFNEMSHSATWEKLNAKIRPSSDASAVGTWVMEVWDDFFIYEKDGKTYYQAYSVDGEEVTLDGVRKEATKKVMYKLSDGTTVGNQEEDTMNKEQVVNQLIANTSSPWTEEDRESLMGMSEAKLAAIVGNSKPAGEPEPAKAPEPAVVAPAQPAAAPKAPEQNAQPAAPAVNAEPTVEQYIANAPAGMRDMLAAGLAAHNAEKAKLVAAITANKRNLFSAAQLNAKDLAELKALAMLAQEPKQQSPAVPSYLGMAEPAAVGNQAEEPLVAPTLNFGPEDK